MTEGLDPYHRWLGIPPKHQPPDHYRLLGLDALEGDPEVIRDAAERQMGHVRQYHLGSHAELSQRILNELAAAKGCLLDPEKKAAYDAQVQVKAKPRRGLLRAKPLPPEETPLQGVSTLVVHPAAATPPPLPASAVAPPRRARATTQRLLLLGLVAAAAGTGLVVAMILWGAGRNARSVTVPPRRSEQAQISLKKQQPVPAQPMTSPPPAKLDSKPAPEIAPVDLAPWRQVAGRVASAVVRLQTIKADGQARQGLGFVADPKGLLVISSTLAIESISGTAFFSDGSFQVLQLPGTLDRVLGVAALRIQPVGAETVGVSRMLTAPGQQVALVRPGKSAAARPCLLSVQGTRAGSEVARTLGGPTEQFGLNPALWLAIDGPIEAEDCGAPLFDAQGDLVGLLAASDVAAKAHFALPAGSLETFLTRIRSAEEERKRIVAVPPPKPVDQILFPSGKAFSEDFYRTAANNPAELVLAAAGNPTGILRLKAVGDYPLAYLAPGLAGAVAAFYDKAATAPGVYLSYRNEVRHGLTAVWDEEKRPTYCCQYSGGKRDGLCCLFEGGQPRLAAELRDDAYLGILLLAKGKIEKSFPNAAAAQSDATAGPMLAEIGKIEAEIVRIEKIMQRKFREEMDDRKEQARRQLAGRQSVQNRKEAQKRMNQRALENNDIMRGLQKKAMER